MPKMKTRRAAAKRFEVRKSGKVAFKHAHLRHCLEHKHKGLKKLLGKTGFLREQDARHVREMLPYG